MINRRLINYNCAFFCPIHRKVAHVLIPWLLLGKSRYLWIAKSKLTEINAIQKPRVHLWHWYYNVLFAITFNIHQPRVLFHCTVFFSDTLYTTALSCAPLSCQLVEYSGKDRLKPETIIPDMVLWSQVKTGLYHVYYDRSQRSYKHW